jgi:hypothetical protein
LTNTERLYRNDVKSECSARKIFPGITSGDTTLFEKFGPYSGTGFPENCITVNLNPLTCGFGATVHLIAYSQEPNPNNLTLGYLGDEGYSQGLADFGYFSVPYIDKTSLWILAQTNFGGSNCQFEFSIAWADCPSAASDLLGTNIEPAQVEELSDVLSDVP